MPSHIRLVGDHHDRILSPKTLRPNALMKWLVVGATTMVHCNRLCRILAIRRGGALLRLNALARAPSQSPLFKLRHPKAVCRQVASCGLLLRMFFGQVRALKREAQTAAMSVESVSLERSEAA